MMREITYWDWRREPDAPRTWKDPGRRLVLCTPGLCDEESYESTSDPDVVARSSGCLMIMPGVWQPDDEPTHGIIPALWSRSQADLGGLDAILQVRAAARALVLCPSEEIDLGPALRDRAVSAGDNTSGIIDSVRPDWICILGGDEPMHPDWVRSAVRRAQAAGVPVTFAGWGEWVPYDFANSTSELRSQIRLDATSERPVFESKVRAGERWFRVGRGVSGALLDGRTIDERPEALR